MRGAGIYLLSGSGGGRHAAALTNLGYLIYSVKKDYDEAERLYRRAVEAAPNDPAALNNLGLLLATARRDFAGAESMYERALKADPRCVCARGAPRPGQARAAPDRVGDVLGARAPGAWVWHWMLRVGVLFASHALRVLARPFALIADFTRWAGVGLAAAAAGAGSRAAISPLPKT